MAGVPVTNPQDTIKLKITAAAGLSAGYFVLGSGAGVTNHEYANTPGILLKDTSVNEYGDVCIKGRCWGIAGDTLYVGSIIVPSTTGTCIPVGATVSSSAHLPRGKALTAATVGDYVEVDLY